MNKVRLNGYAIDCDDINNEYDKPKGHSYFTDDGVGNIGVVFKHMLNSIQSGRVKVSNAADRTYII